MKIDEKKLRVLMAEQGLTAGKLAAKMGVTGSCITQYKYGTVRPLTAHKLAAALGVGVEAILIEEETTV
jgi:DNA-binding XRE family transcriptional regulator